MNQPVLEEVEGEDKVRISSLRVCRPRGESRVQKMGCLLGAARSHLFKDFLLQILFCKLKGLLPSPRSNFADLRLAGDLRIFVNFGPILNLIRCRVNIKFSAPSKIKLRSLP